MESDPALAKSLEDNLARRVGFVKPESEVVQSELRTKPSKRTHQDEGEPPESAITEGASRCVAEMQTIRPLDADGDDDMVCGLDVCDEPDECNVYVNDCEGDYTDELSGVTLLRDDGGQSAHGGNVVVRQVQSLRESGKMKRS